MAGKSDQSEIEARVGEVYTMLLKGASRREIQQYAATKTDWGVLPRMVDEYIRRANQELAKLAQSRREQELGKSLARLNYLFQNALKISDYKTCVSVQKEINALLGLYAPTKQEVTGKDGGAIEIALKWDNERDG